MTIEELQQIVENIESIKFLLDERQISPVRGSHK